VTQGVFNKGSISGMVDKYYTMNIRPWIQNKSVICIHYVEKLVESVKMHLVLILTDDQSQWYKFSYIEIIGRLEHVAKEFLTITKSVGCVYTFYFYTVTWWCNYMTCGVWFSRRYMWCWLTRLYISRNLSNGWCFCIFIYIWSSLVCTNCLCCTCFWSSLHIWNIYFSHLSGLTFSYNGTCFLKSKSTSIK
jgi:hypothetical protein